MHAISLYQPKQFLRMHTRLIKSESLKLVLGNDFIRALRVILRCSQSSELLFLFGGSQSAVLGPVAQASAWGLVINAILEPH